MLKSRLPSAEAWSAILGVALGVAVSMKLALGVPGIDFFVVNTLGFWIPQLVVLGLLLLFKPRPAVVAGVAGVLAIYCWVYAAGIRSTNDREGLAYLGYVFSFPGAAIGASFIGQQLHLHPVNNAITAAVAAAFVVASGIFVNQVMICHTVIYCSWLKPF